MNTTANGSLTVEAMDHGELKNRLLYLHRNGRIAPYPHNLVMGHAKRLKAGCPTEKDLSTVRRLIIDARQSADDPVVLIDEGDDETEHFSQNPTYAEF